MNVEQIEQAARARLAEIPKEIRALQHEEQRLVAMLSDGTTSRNALAKPHNPAIDEQPKLDCFRQRYGDAGFDIVRNIVGRGGEVDIREVKRALGMEPDTRGIWPRSNLIPAALRCLGCTETAHAKWIAPR
jgi:hypothetical protein